MSYTYTFANAENTAINRKDDEGNVVLITVDSGSCGWNEFLASGKTVAPYVAPPAPSEPTPEEKLARSGLTVDELKELLGLNS